jgi:hypothetical protein
MLCTDWRGMSCWCCHFPHQNHTNSTPCNLQPFSLCSKKELPYYEPLANYHTSSWTGGIASAPRGGCPRGGPSTPNPVGRHPCGGPSYGITPPGGGFGANNPVAGSKPLLVPNWPPLKALFQGPCSCCLQPCLHLPFPSKLLSAMRPCPTSL